MPRATRAGFTLVELLVVMSLVIVLAALAVAVSESGAFGSQKVISGGDRASGWLLIAKQRAIRDQRPRGVRFLLQPHPQAPGATAPNDYCNFAFTAREAQYIEVPDSWTPDRTRPLSLRAFLAFAYTTTPEMTYVSPVMGDAKYYPSKSPSNARRVFVVLPDPTDQSEFSQRVQAGALLALPGTGATFRIDQIFAWPGQTLTVNGTTYTNAPGLSPVAELVLGQATAFPMPSVPSWTYPDLGAATSGPVAGTQLAPPVPCATEYNFAFMAGFSTGGTGLGGPLPLVGEPLLQLTGNSVIDVRAPHPSFGFVPASDPYATAPAAPYYPRTSVGVSIAGNATTGYFVDVLFGPSGQVMGTADGLVALWVRDPDKVPHPRLSDPANNNGLDQTASFDTAGEQVLVTVYTRTGLIATHPVSKGTNPHAAARDGLNSGL